MSRAIQTQTVPEVPSDVWTQMVTSSRAALCNNRRLVRVRQEYVVLKRQLFL